MTQNYFPHLAFLFFLFLIETAGRKVLEQNSFFVPMLLLLACLAAAQKFSIPKTLWTTFFAGFLLEIFSGQFFGSYIFGLEFAVLPIWLLTRRITRRDDSALGGAIFAAVGTVFFVFGIYAYCGLFGLLGFGEGGDFKSFFSSKLLWTIAVNVIAFYPVKFFLGILSKQSEKSF